MNKRVLVLALASANALFSIAQDAYTAGILSTEDLNGTARYVGMGGAMEALGADLSTISTNPAGVGLFRHSEASLSLGVVSQQDATKFADANVTNLSFDQIGFVWSSQISNQSFVNFAFNFHKSRNFNQILSASNAFAHSSWKENNEGEVTEIIGSGQNIQTMIKGLGGCFSNDNIDYDGRNYYESQVDARYSSLLHDKNQYWPLTASGFDFNRGTTGYIGVYDFNISGNSRDRIYWGVTVGIHDVHYDDHSIYNENVESGLKLFGTTPVSNIGLRDERTITGTGVDIKAGIIVRPIEESPFRVGINIATPTWYDLTTDNYTTVYAHKETRDPGESYEFKFYTPWKFGINAGHTIDNYLALGASYEYTDLGAADMREITYSGYDGDESRSDKEMSTEIGHVLKGVHTLKLGAEFKPDPAVAVRLGYNYVSPAYDSKEFRNQVAYSPGVYYASTTDYTNWKDTHRITAGIGTKIDKIRLDLAYQYSTTKGDFYPFTQGLDYSEDSGFYIQNNCDATSVNFKRHQVLFTLGYTF